MKQILSLLVLLVASANAQNPFVQSDTLNGPNIKWYATTGVPVSGGVATDTVVSEVFDAQFYDDIALSFRAGTGDTIWANFYYRFVNGPLTLSGETHATQNAGFYRSGADALSSLIDSVGVNSASNAVAAVNAKNNASVAIPAKGDRLSTTTHQIYMRTNGATGVAISDSIVTYNYTNPRAGYAYVQFVVIFHQNHQEGLGRSSGILRKGTRVRLIKR